ncbi:MAG: AbrB/MazE/SpoVT family DNA-binding domain-containing protein [Methylotenera sp.]
MKLKIQKWGNSAAIRLPATLLAQIGATIDDTVEIDPEAFRVAKPNYKLADLLAQCNKNAPPPTDLASWESISPVGAEIL